MYKCDEFKLWSLVRITIDVFYHKKIIKFADQSILLIKFNPSGKPSTMVTAGVLMKLRFHKSLSYTTKISKLKIKPKTKNQKNTFQLQVFQNFPKILPKRPSKYHLPKTTWNHNYRSNTYVSPLFFTRANSALSGNSKQKKQKYSKFL